MNVWLHVIKNKVRFLNPLILMTYFTSRNTCFFVQNINFYKPFQFVLQIMQIKEHNY